MHKLAECYGHRPSDLLCIENSWLAFEFDCAVFAHGRFVDNKLEEYEKPDKKGNRKRKWTLAQILNGETEQRRGGLTDIFLASGQDIMDGPLLFK